MGNVQVKSGPDIVVANDTVKVSIEEEITWLIVDEFGSKYCCLCDQNFEDVTVHETTNEHFQHELLWNMREWFAAKRTNEEQNALEAKVLEEETFLDELMTFVGANESNADANTWTMVSKRSNKSKKNHLKGRTGQL
jgi:hypothetical protein